MDNTALKISTNTDTGFLKVVAFFTMLIDHVGYVFFPDYFFMRIIGRIAFPIFAYCLVVGFVYTKNLKKYALRILAFAVVSQPFYTLAFFPDTVPELFDPKNYSTLFSSLFFIIENLCLNIGFTLLLGLLALYGIKSKKLFFTAFSVLLSLFGNYEYGIYGVGIIVFMYLFIGTSKVNFAFGVGAFMFIDFFIGGFYEFFGIPLNPQGFAVLSLLLFLINTKSNIKIPRLINYGFYPVHLAAIYFINTWLQ